MDYKQIKEILYDIEAIRLAKEIEKLKRKIGFIIPLLSVLDLFEVILLISGFMTNSVGLVILFLLTIILISYVIIFFIKVRGNPMKFKKQFIALQTREEQVIEEKAIQEFEKRINYTIPDDFKSFLHEVNGGDPKGVLFTHDFIEIDPINGEPHNQGTDIDQFYSLEEIEFDYYDYLEDDYIPSTFIPFAISSFGNLLLLYLGDTEDYGGVYFANHDLFDSKTNQYVISKVSSSFSEFIQELYKQRPV